MIFRLHIDIPMSGNESEAREVSRRIMTCFHNPLLLEYLRSVGVPSVNYRLGHDDDRQKSNYFIKTTRGHVANKKIRINTNANEQDPQSSEKE
jgi:hypothetical protein